MRKKVCFLFAVLLVLIILVSCSPSTDDNGFDSNTMRITAVIPHEDFGYWSYVAKGVQSASEKLQIDVKICIPQLNYNIDQMIEYINQATISKVDAIVVQGIDDSKYIEALEKAREQGIAIGFVDSDVKTFSTHIYVGTDNYAAGELMGEKLIETSQGHANIGVILGAEGYNNIQQRLEGLKHTISKQEDIKIVSVEYNDFDTMTAMRKYESLLENEPSVDTIVCLEGTSGQTFGTMLESRDNRIKNIMAFDYGDDVIAGLRIGVIDSLVVQKPIEMGEKIICELYHFQQDGFYEKNVVFTGVDYITKEDLSDEGKYIGE